jgi:simple sugar transport system permease protein
VPYALTLAILVLTCAPDRRIAGAPAELGMQR